MNRGIYALLGSISTGTYIMALWLHNGLWLIVGAFAMLGIGALAVEEDHMGDDGE